MKTFLADSLSLDPWHKLHGFVLINLDKASLTACDSVSLYRLLRLGITPSNGCFLDILLPPLPG